MDLDIGSGMPSIPALEYLLAENNAFAISAELIIRLDAILAGMGAADVVQLVDVLVDVFSYTILLERFCSDAAYEGKSGSFEDGRPAKLDAPKPGVKPASILFAAAKLSRPVAPSESGILEEPKPKAMLVNISNPVG